MTSPNPLLIAWTAPFGLPPFDAIRPEHFEDAFAHAMRVHRDELRAIADDGAEPGFDNTVAAFDRAGRLLGRIGAVFYNLTASHTSDALQAVQRRLAAPLAAHDSAVYLDERLFARVDALHARRESLGLGPEQRRLLERLHLDFVRAGARLQGPARARYAAVMSELAELTTRFGQNVLHDENAFRLVLRTEAELAGLPDFVRAAARQAAAERGLDAGAHLVTLSRSLVLPFLTFSERRDLREQAWRAWTSRGEHAGAADNRDVARAILRLRHEQARLHGHASYADYALADTMAGRRDAVQRLFDEVWPRALAAVQREREALEARMAAVGAAGPIEAWDWRYWAEKVRQVQYAVDDAEVKPYFRLESMVQAAFDCASRLFGLRFTPRDDVPLYHPDVRAYEVRDAGDRVVGLFLQDNFARPSKRSGAWMSSLQWQNRNAPDQTGASRHAPDRPARPGMRRIGRRVATHRRAWPSCR
ncbi:MAG: M3 family metallopeptidase [Rubrivivax sp.]